jgi:membrane-bound lytic murein transglycosylase D
MSQRSILLWGTLVGVLGLVIVTHRQADISPADARSESMLGWVDERVRPVLYANPPATTDSVSDAEAFRHIARLHRLRSDLAEAQAASNGPRTSRLLDRSIRELHALLGRPGLAERPRFRSIFRSLTAEYEAHYGVPDTLRLPGGAIYENRQGLFAALNQAPPLQLNEVLPSGLQLTNTDIRLPLNERVRTSMAFLLRNADRHLRPWLQRSATYFPMIEHILAEENVPDELKYLALVESGLNPYAYSHARAAGPWQFIAQTGRRYGLTVDPWVDERLDPEKSTRAAARHLRDLYELFGDWHLALAGYNCSPRAVQRAIAEARERLGREPTFWDIYPQLPEETRNYVPLFIATAVIVSNPSEFGIERVTPGPRYAFDHVPVEGAHSLQTIARLAETDIATVRSLNPELRSDRLPSSAEPYYVRLPYGTYTTFASNYAALPNEEKRPNVGHAVRAGETIGRIAQRYQVARPALLKTNDVKPHEVHVGQRLTIPAMRYLGNTAIAAEADARPVRVRYGNRATRPLTAEPVPDLAAVTPSSPAASSPAAGSQP